MPGPEKFSIDYAKRSRDHSKQKRDEEEAYLDGPTDGEREAYFHERVRSKSTFGTDEPLPTKEEVEARIPKDRLRPGRYSIWARNPHTGELEEVQPARYSVYGRPQREKAPEPQVYRDKPRRKPKKAT